MLDSEKMINKFESGIRRLEKKPELNELGEILKIIENDNFLNPPKEKIKVLIDGKERLIDKYEFDDVNYLKIDDTVFVYCLMASGNYDVSIGLKGGLFLNQLKRKDFILVDIISKSSESCLVFFKDEKEKKVYNLGQLSNINYPKNKLAGFKVEELENGMYRLSFYIESKGMSEDQVYYYRLGIDNFNPKKQDRKIYYNINV